jgi:hypothetical protein
MSSLVAEIERRIEVLDDELARVAPSALERERLLDRPGADPRSAADQTSTFAEASGDARGRRVGAGPWFAVHAE